MNMAIIKQKQLLQSPTHCHLFLPYSNMKIKGAVLSALGFAFDLPDDCLPLINRLDALGLFDLIDENSDTHMLNYFQTINSDCLELVFSYLFGDKNPKNNEPFAFSPAEKLMREKYHNHIVSKFKTPDQFMCFLQQMLFCNPDSITYDYEDIMSVIFDTNDLE